MIAMIFSLKIKCYVAFIGPTILVMTFLLLREEKKKLKVLLWAEENYGHSRENFPYSIAHITF